MGTAARSFMSVDRANPSVYREVSTRMSALKAIRPLPTPARLAPQLNALMRQLGVPPSSSEYIDFDLEGRSRKASLLLTTKGGRGGCQITMTNPWRWGLMNRPLEWISGHEYVRLWEQLHRVEETFLLDTDANALIGEATRDTL